MIHEYLPCDFPDPYRELVVTTLVPYALAMPMLRYRTGDLVRLGKHCSVANKVGFDYVGRMADCASFSDGLVLAPVVITNALSMLSGIRRRPVGDLLENQFPLPPQFRLPVYKCIAESGAPMRVLVETAEDPACEMSEVEEELLGILTEVDPRIPSHITVEFVSSGTLRR